MYANTVCHSERKQPSWIWQILTNFTLFVTYITYNKFTVYLVHHKDLFEIVYIENNIKSYKLSTLPFCIWLIHTLKNCVCDWSCENPIKIWFKNMINISFGCKIFTGVIAILIRILSYNCVENLLVLIKSLTTLAYLATWPTNNKRVVPMNKAKTPKQSCVWNTINLPVVLKLDLFLSCTIFAVCLIERNLLQCVFFQGNSPWPNNDPKSRPILVVKFNWIAEFPPTVFAIDECYVQYRPSRKRLDDFLWNVFSFGANCWMVDWTITAECYQCWESFNILSTQLYENLCINHLLVSISLVQFLPTSYFFHCHIWLDTLQVNFLLRNT